MQLTAQHRRWQFTVLTTTFFAYIGFYLTRKVFGNIKKPLATDLDWTLQDTANIWTAFLIAYMVGQFLNGFIGRNLGPKLTILIGLGISMGCGIVFGCANSVNTFMVFMIINGLVQASGWPGVVGGVAHWLGKGERGTFMGLWSSSYVVANMFVKWACALFLAYLGWRYAFFGMTLLTLVIWTGFLLFQRDKPEDVGLAPIVTPEEEKEGAVVEAVMKESITLMDYVRLGTSPVIVLMGLSYFCIKFLRYALDSWLPTFLTLQNMDPSHAAAYSSIFDIAGIVGALAAGLLLDRVFNNNWIAVCLLMAVGCVGSYGLVLYFGTSPVLLAWLFGTVGFMLYGPDTIICGAAAVTVAGERNALAAVGLINGIGSIGPIVQEQVIGRMVDEKQPVSSLHNINYLFLGMACALVVLLTFQLVLYRRKLAHQPPALSS